VHVLVHVMQIQLIEMDEVEWMPVENHGQLIDGCNSNVFCRFWKQQVMSLGVLMELSWLILRKLLETSEILTEKPVCCFHWERPIRKVSFAFWLCACQWLGLFIVFLFLCVGLYSNDYQLIMTVLYKRLNDTGRNWRHVYKVNSTMLYSTDVVH
jgi:hypothetical protein